MFRYLGCIVSALACLMFPHFSAAQQVATRGQLSVSTSGVQYTIPIKVPAGVAKMQPNLALTYSSATGSNGWLGVGWSISGFSVITRCAKTVAQDGVRGALTNTGTDRYCLNGERLIAINGIDGQNGTEYRTERDTFARIVAYTSSTPGQPFFTGPQSWTVLTKSGQTMGFDNGSTSAFAADGRTVKAWALSYIRDTAGNYMAFKYSNMSYENTSSPNSVVDGVFYPTSIDYTGHNPATYGGSTLPMSHVVFNWQKIQNEIPSRYAGGQLLPRTDRRLVGLSMYTGNSLVANSVKVKFYNFNYDPERVDYAKNLPSRLKSIEECDGRTLVCLPALQLGWEADGQPFQFWASSSAPGTQKDYQNYFVDVNGDGRKYWLQISQGADDAWFGVAKADGSFSPDRWTKYAQSIGSLNNFEHFFADVNGDGKADWVRVSRTTNEAWIALGVGNGNFSAWTKYAQSVGAAKDSQHYFADINGDGKADWIQINRTMNIAQIGLATTNGNFQFLPPMNVPYGLTNAAISFGDINGDGKADWLVKAKAGGVTALLSVGDGTFTDNAKIANNTASSNSKFYFADVNGDGMVDLITIDPNLGNTVALSTGAGSAPPYFVRNINDAALDLVDFADINGDGTASRIISSSKQWIAGIVFRPSSGNSTVASETSVPFNPPLPDPVAGVAPAGYQRFYADLNGDGKADMILIDLTTNKAWVALAQLSTYGKLTSVASGAEAPTRIVYAGLSDTRVYTPDSDAIYPLRDTLYPALGAQRAPSLVASVIMPNGNGGNVTTNYTYGGLKTDLSRSVVLGFRWMQATQLETGISTRTEYRLDWPYTGSISGTRKTIQAGGNNGVLSQSNTSYGCKDFVSTSGCTVTIGRRYFVFPGQSVSSAWDLDGTALPTVTTTTQYDDFGNPLQVTTASSDGFSKTVTTSYVNEAPPLETNFNPGMARWRIGLPTRITVTSTAP